MCRRVRVVEDRAGCTCTLLGKSRQSRVGGSDTAKQHGPAFDLLDELAAVYQQARLRSRGRQRRPPTAPPAGGHLRYGRDGVIRWTFVNTDYTTRAEPANILYALDASA